MAKRREDEEYYTLTNKNTNVVQPGGGLYKAAEGAAEAYPAMPDAYGGAYPAMPDAYGGAYKEAVERYTHLAPFTYDYRSDPVWQAYRKEYAREGRRATEDTLGQYAAMTGGVPSTAAVTAASQAGDYYNAQLTDKLPGLYDLAYAMYSGEADRLYRQLSALRDARGDELGRYQTELSRWNAERKYADTQAEKERQRQKEEEASTVYGYGSDGSSYRITSKLGRDFISQARYGDPDMTGGDGSIWHKNEDGTVTITRTDGRTYTVSGTPEEWTGLTLAQMWDAIDRANKTGTEIPPNVLKAWEHFMGGSYASAPAATGGGYTGGGYGGGVTPAAAPVGNKPEYEPLVYEPQTFTPTLMPLDSTFGVNPAPGTIPSAGEYGAGIPKADYIDTVNSIIDAADAGDKTQTENLINSIYPYLDETQARDLEKDLRKNGININLNR